MTEYNKNFRLQILSHDEVFATREKAVKYIDDFFKPEALISEPAIVYYGDLDNPNAIMAIGSGERKVFIIDFAEITEKINNIEDVNSQEKQDLTQAIKTINGIIKSCGLLFDPNKVDEQVSYEPDKKDILIGDVSNIADAINVLSKYIQKEVADNTLSVEDTKSVKLNYDNNTESNGKVLKAYVKISTDGDTDEEGFNNNIVGIKTDGLYASSHLEYNEDKNQLIFRTSGKKNGRFQDDAFKQVINLGKHSEIIESNSDSEPVKIKVINEDNKNKISGSLKLSEISSNILKVQDGSLLVDGRASNIRYKEGTVFEAINSLQKDTKELSDKSVLIETDSDTVDLTIGKNASGNTTIGGEVKRSNDGTIIVSEGGLSVKMDLDIDNANNTLILKLGNKEPKKIELPSIDLTDIVTSIYYDKSQRTLTIKFSNGQSTTIDIADLLTPYEFKSDDDSPVKLTEISVPEKGTSIVKASLKVRIADNLIDVANGEIFVSETKIKGFIDEAKSELNDSITALDTKLNDSVTELKEKDDTLNGLINTNKNAIAEEVNRATEAEGNLKGLIDNNKDSIDDINGEISSIVEINKQQDDEIKAVQKSVVDETSRAQNVENEIKADIVEKHNNLNTAVQSEITRAKNAEKALRKDVASNTSALEIINGGVSVDGSMLFIADHIVKDVVTPAIKLEEDKRIESDNAINGRIDTIESTITSVSDTTLENAKAYTDIEIVKVNHSIDNAKAEVSNEAKADATAKAEKALSDAKTYADEKVNAEKERALAAEKVNADAIVKLQEVNSSFNDALIKKVETVELVKDEANDLHYTLLVDNVNKGEINIPKDQTIKSVEYNSASKEIEFIFITSNGEQLVKINIGDLVDTYEAGNGLNLTDNIFSVKIAEASEKTYITVTPDGITIKGLDAALSSKADKSDVYSKEEADSKFLTEHQSLDNLATKESLSETNQKIADLETAVTENENNIDLIINGNEAANGSLSNILKQSKDYSDSVVKTESDRAQGAEKILSDAIDVLNGNSEVEGSVLNAVKQSKYYTDTQISIEKQERVNSDLTLKNSIDTKANISDVYTKAEIDTKGYLVQTDIANLANKNDVDTLKTTVDGINSKVTANEDKLKQIDSEVTDINTNISDIKKSVNENTSEISDLKISVQNNKFNVVSTDTVDLSLRADEADSVKKLSANIKVSQNEGNIIKNNNGLFAISDLTYDKATNSITFNNGLKNETYQLAGVSAIEDVRYDSNENNLIFVVKQADGTTKEVSINAADFTPQIAVNNPADSPLRLTITKDSTTGQQTLSGEIAISESDGNGIIKNNGTLYASKKAEDHTIITDKGEEILSSVVLGLLKDIEKYDKWETTITEIQSSMEIIKNTVNAINNTIISLQTEVSSLKQEVEKLKTNDENINNRLDGIDEVINNLIDFGTYNE